jgi:DNA-binding IclR family transcriptional regulator
MLERVRPIPGRGAAASPAVESLSEEQQRIIEVLQSQEQGMTARQLQMRLEWPGGRVQPWVDSLVECQLVARLNTVIPSYICR